MKLNKFNSISEKYNSTLPYFNNGKIRKDHEIRISLEQLFFDKFCRDNNIYKPKILDVGCHDGQLLKIITKNSEAELFGIDTLDEVVKKAKLNGINALLADLDDGIPFEESSFDFLVAGEIIEHLYDPEHFLKESKKVLKNNSGIIVTIPNICSLRNRLRVMFGAFPFHYNSSAHEKWGDHIRLFNLQSMVSLLEKQGFKIQSVASNGLLGKGIFKYMFASFGDIIIIYATKC